MQGGLSPSERDGLSREQEQAFKRTAINTIIDAGSLLSMDVVALSAAIVFLHRFYAAKSLVRNDPFLMSMACLYLGGKAQDCPKSVKDVLLASFEVRWGKDAVRRIGQDREVYEGLKERVFVAERALLYALNFDFAYDHPAKEYIEIMKGEEFRAHREALAAARGEQRVRQINQFAYNLIRDSLRTDACLHYTGRQVAAACIWLSMKLLKEDTHIYTDKGHLWWVQLGVQEEHLEGVASLLQQLYTGSMQDVTSNHNLVLRSAALVPPAEQAAAAAAAAVTAPAAPAPPPQAGAAAAAAALPADVAAANQASWAAVQAPAAAPPLPPQPEAAGGEAAAEDYDDLLKELSP